MGCAIIGLTSLTHRFPEQPVVSHCRYSLSDVLPLALCAQLVPSCVFSPAGLPLHAYLTPLPPPPRPAPVGAMLAGKVAEHTHDQQERWPVALTLLCLLLSFALLL